MSVELQRQLGELRINNGIMRDHLMKILNYTMQTDKFKLDFVSGAIPLEEWGLYTVQDEETKQIQVFYGVPESQSPIAKATGAENPEEPVDTDVQE